MWSKIVSLILTISLMLWEIKDITENHYGTMNIVMLIVFSLIGLTEMSEIVRAWRSGARFD